MKRINVTTIHSQYDRSSIDTPLFYVRHIIHHTTYYVNCLYLYNIVDDYVIFYYYIAISSLLFVYKCAGESFSHTSPFNNEVNFLNLLTSNKNVSCYYLSAASIVVAGLLGTIFISMLHPSPAGTKRDTPDSSVVIAKAVT